MSQTPNPSIQSRKHSGSLGDQLQTPNYPAAILAVAHKEFSNLNPQTLNFKTQTSNARVQVFNIGNSSPKVLIQYIEALEKALGKTAKKNFMDIQAGVVPATHAVVSKLEGYVNFRLQTTVEEGVKRFVEWYTNRK